MRMQAGAEASSFLSYHCKRDLQTTGNMSLDNAQKFRCCNYQNTAAFSFVTYLCKKFPPSCKKWKRDEWKGKAGLFYLVDFYISNNWAKRKQPSAAGIFSKKTGRFITWFSYQ